MSHLDSFSWSPARFSSQESGPRPGSLEGASYLERYEVYICALSEAVLSVENEPTDGSLELVFFFQDAVVRDQLLSDGSC